MRADRAPRSSPSPIAQRERLGASIPVEQIGEPVAAVTLNSPVWKTAAGPLPAYCSIDGSMAPVETSGKAKPILFRVLLPSEWSERAAQLGGGGMNGMIPNLTMAFGVTTGPGLLERGFATYGSDSGHTMAGYRLGAERRIHQEPWVHATEKDSRRRDGADPARLRSRSLGSITSSEPHKAAARPSR